MQMREQRMRQAADETVAPGNCWPEPLPAPTDEDDCDDCRRVRDGVGQHEKGDAGD